MNALALLNNFEREFASPFFKDGWLEQLADHRMHSGFSASMKFDDEKSVWNLAVELPGVTKDNVKINTAEGLLQLTGEKTKGVMPGKFEASYQLPENVDTEKIEATFEDGILNVTIPTAEKKSAKTIQIK